MILPHWLRRLSRSSSVHRLPPARHRRLRARPKLEGLEERVVPSTFEVVQASQANGTTTFASLTAALGVAKNGDTIQVEAGSTPGSATVTQNNLTIQGDPAVGAKGLAASGTEVTGLTLQGNNDTVTNLFIDQVLIAAGSTGETVSNCIVNNGNVQQAAGAGTDGGNTVTGNTFQGAASVVLGDFSANASGDVVTNNTLKNSTGTNPITVINETSGFLISGNTITQSGSAAVLGIAAVDSSGTISDNQVTLASNAGSIGIVIQGNSSVTNDTRTTNVVISGNTVSTSGGGHGITTDRFWSTEPFTVKIENNDLHDNLVGIDVRGDGAGGSADYGTIDAGGGSTGSVGGNDLHGFTGSGGNFAITASDNGKAAAGTKIFAQFNPFNVTDPQTVVSADTNTTIDTSNAETGVTVQASGQSAAFTPAAQTVQLQALVTDSQGHTVNGGVVTFTVTDSQGHTVGTPLSGVLVVNGVAAGNYNLPAGLTVGPYTIGVHFTDPNKVFGDIGDTAGALNVVGANVTTKAGDATAVFSTASQTVHVSATLTDTSHSADTVTEGTVTFSLTDSGGNGVGNAVTVSVSGGSAATDFTLPNGLAAGNYSINVSYADTGSGKFRDDTDTSGKLTVSPADAKTKAGDVTVAFSTTDQTVHLGATLTDASHPAETVNEGTVTFTVKDSGGHVVGSSVSGSVQSDGTAVADYLLPGGQARGTYTINVSYADSAGDFKDAGDTSATLAVGPDQVVTGVLSTFTAAFSTHTVTGTLTAQVADITNPSITVTKGTVTFTVTDSGGHTIGSSVSGSVQSDGSVSASYTLPAGQPVGTYTISVSYKDSTGDFVDGGDSGSTLTVVAAGVSTASLSAATDFSPGGQVVLLQATLADLSHPADTVNAGSVLFQVSDADGNVVGGAVDIGTVVGGHASARYFLPAGLGVGTYTVQVGYNDPAGNFTFASNTPGPLTVSPARVVLTASPVTTVFSSAPQALTLTASVIDISHSTDTVSGGAVLFTVTDGAGHIIGSPALGVISSGVATGTYTLPAGQGPGSYSISASLIDPPTNISQAGSVSAALTVLPGTAAVELAQVSTVPNLFTLTETETLVAHVSGFGGTVAFHIAGKTLFANVDGNGDASVTLTLPLFATAGPQGISVSFGGATAAAVVQWQPLDMFVPATSRIMPDGSQFVVFGPLDSPIFNWTFDGQGRLVGFGFAGFQIGFGYNSRGLLTVITLDGLPVVVLG